jgi:hypothetical protein
MADHYSATVRQVRRWLYEIRGTGHLDSTWITLEGPRWHKLGRRRAERSAQRHVRRMNRRAARERAADASKTTVTDHGIIGHPGTMTDGDMARFRAAWDDALMKGGRRA